MAGLHTNRGAKRAREARERYGLHPSAPLDCLLTAVGSAAEVPVVVGQWGSDALGCCLHTGETTVLWVRSGEPTVRQRFTLAHELGHLCCGHDGNIPVETPETINGRVRNPVETQANAFAAAFLVPAAAIEEHLDEDPPFEEIVLLASAYGVSAIVVQIRLQTLGMASEDHDTAVRERIDRQEHIPLAESLEAPKPDDLLERLRDATPPYLSPAIRGSTLGAVLDGTCPIADAAAHLGVAPQDVEAMLTGLGLTEAPDAE